MTETAVVSFSEAPVSETGRRLADLPDRVVEGDPQHVTKMFFESPDGKLISGTWTSTPGKWHAFTDRDEFCSILSGRCRFQRGHVATAAAALDVAAAVGGSVRDLSLYGRRTWLPVVRPLGSRGL